MSRRRDGRIGLSWGTISASKYIPQSPAHHMPSPDVGHRLRVRVTTSARAGLCVSSVNRKFNLRLLPCVPRPEKEKEPFGPTVYYSYRTRARYSVFYHFRSSFTSAFAVGLRATWSRAEIAHTTSNSFQPHMDSP